MGIYLNPGADMLRQGRNSKIYVGKSALIACLNGAANTEHPYACINRLQRFGRSMAENMVSAHLILCGIVKNPKIIIWPRVSSQESV